MIDSDVAESLDGLIRAIHRAYRVRLNARGLDLGPAEIQALRFLERQPGARLHQLVTESGRDKAQVTRTVRAVESEGLVTRARDPEDQRCHCLQLTEAGREIVATLHEVRAEIEGRLFAELDNNEQDRLDRLLRRCLSSLQSAERQTPRS